MEEEAVCLESAETVAATPAALYSFVLTTRSLFTRQTVTSITLSLKTTPQAICTLSAGITPDQPLQASSFTQRAERLLIQAVLELASFSTSQDSPAELAEPVMIQPSVEAAAGVPEIPAMAVPEMTASLAEPAALMAVTVAMVAMAGALTRMVQQEPRLVVAVVALEQQTPERQSAESVHAASAA